MMEEVLAIAKERQINLVLPRETVLAAATTLDITDEVVKRIDKAMPSLALELVKPAKEPPKRGEAPPARRRPAARPQAARAEIRMPDRRFYTASGPFRLDALASIAHAELRPRRGGRTRDARRGRRSTPPVRTR